MTKEQEEEEGEGKLHTGVRNRRIGEQKEDENGRGGEKEIYATARSSSGMRKNTLLALGFGTLRG